MTEATAAPDNVEEPPLPTVTPAAAETVAVIITRASSLHQQVEALTIEDDDGLENAAELISSVRALRREVATDLGEPATEARKLWEMIRARFTKHDGPLKADEDTLKEKVGAYHQRVKLLRQQEIDAANAQREATATDSEARGQEFDALMEAGDTEGAQAVLDQAPTPAPARSTSPPKTKGLSVGETWKAEIVDVSKLIKAAAEGNSVALSILSDVKVVKAATGAAGQIAKGMKANMNVPGVRAYPEPRVAAGKR